MRLKFLIKLLPKTPTALQAQSTLYTYFKTTFKLYKEGATSTEDLFEKYEEISEKFDLEQTNLAKKLDVILNKLEMAASLNI
jgi:Cdc6-like AAA superfamily ATPase